MAFSRPGERLSAEEGGLMRWVGGTQARIKTAKRRIFIASLYLGKEETEFVSGFPLLLERGPGCPPSG